MGDGNRYEFDPTTYREMIESEVPCYRDLQLEMARACGPGEVSTVLELGVGTGETTAAVLAVHPEARVTGVDESERMLAVARARFPHADLRVQRLEDPLPVGEFDLVVSALTVHHLEHPEKVMLFHRVAQRLRPGGRFVLADLVVPDDPDEVVTPVEPGHDKPSTVSDQLRWLEEAGLQPTVAWAGGDLAVLVAEH